MCYTEDNAHEASRCVEGCCARTRRRRLDDERDERREDLYSFKIQCHLSVFLRRVSLTLWRKGRVCAQPRVLSSRGE